LSFNIVDYTKISAFSEITQKHDGQGGKSPNPSFFNVFLNHMPNTKAAIADKARPNAAEMNVMLNQMRERLLAESSARRLELVAKLLQKDNEESPYDLYMKCLDIARRIMRGEKVSQEEMTLLAQHFPELLFMALLFKQDEVDLKYEDDLPENEEAPSECSDVSGNSTSTAGATGSVATDSGAAEAGAADGG